MVGSVVHDTSRWQGVPAATVSLAVGVASVWWLTAPAQVCVSHRISPHHWSLDCQTVSDRALPVPLALVVLLLAAVAAAVLVAPIVGGPASRLGRWGRRVAVASLVVVALVPVVHATELAGGPPLTTYARWASAAFYVTGGCAVALAVLMGIPVLVEQADLERRRGCTARAGVASLAVLGTAVTASLVGAGAPLPALPWPLLLVAGAFAVLAQPEDRFGARAHSLLLGVVAIAAMTAGVMLIGVLGALAFADALGPLAFFGWPLALVATCLTGLVAEPSAAGSLPAHRVVPGTPPTRAERRAAGWLVGVLAATAVAGPATVVALSAALCGLGSCYGSAGPAPAAVGFAVVLVGSVTAIGIAVRAAPRVRARVGRAVGVGALPYALLFFATANAALGGGSGDYFAITAAVFLFAVLVAVVLGAVGLSMVRGSRKAAGG